MRTDAWSARGESDGKSTASFSDAGRDHGKEITRGALEGPMIAGNLEPLAPRKRSGRHKQHLRSRHIWQEESDTAAMLQMSGAALLASGSDGQAGEEL